MRIVFAGTPEFAAVALRALLDGGHDLVAVFTQPDRAAGRGRRVQIGPVKRLAVEHGVALYQPETLRGAREQEILRAAAPDVMVVVAYGLLLPAAVLGIPRLGCINIHASLLPRWRGAAPIQHALLAGDAETGITIIQMDAGLDSGAMLCRERCPIGPRDTAATLHDRLAALGARALLPTLAHLAEGTVTPCAQDVRRVCYAPKIDKSDALIDWLQPAVRLERMVRAFDPWPVAYTVLPGGARLRVWRAELVAHDSGRAPGTIVRAAHDGIDVAAGAGVLRLLEVQLPGGRRLSVGAFANAHALAPGMVLGVS